MKKKKIDYLKSFHLYTIYTLGDRFKIKQKVTRFIIIKLKIFPILVTKKVTKL